MPSLTETPLAHREYPVTDANHELLRVFEAHALPLCRQLTEMLNEHLLHRTERRGCGFTQATRFLAALINIPELAPAADGGLFRPGVERHLGGRRALIEHVGACVESIMASLRFPESRLLAEIIGQVALRNGTGIDLGHASPEKLAIGTCPLAEQYFLEVAYESIRRGGIVNIIVDDQRKALLIEKCALGDNHSSISVARLALNGVELPLGSLVGIDRVAADDTRFAQTRNGRGRIIPLREVRSVRFLRLTTLAVAPPDRRRAFTTHFEQQVSGGLFSPEATEISQLVRFAEAQTDV